MPSRSEEIEDIMEKTPAWMTRWGISLFFAFITLLLGVSWFIKYPDVINTNIVITSEYPPVNLVAQSAGKIKLLMVKDKDRVDSNTTLALIDNPAEYKDVIALKKLIADSSFINKPLPNYQLGEIEAAYSTFKQANQDFTSFKTIALYQHKIIDLENQVASQQLIYNRISQQLSTLNEEYKLAVIKFQADSQLFIKGVIAKLDFNNSRNTLLEKKYAYQGTNATLSQTQLQIDVLNTSLTELKSQNETDGAKYSNELHKSLEQLHTAIKTWEQEYLIVAPIRGTVNLFNYWAVNMPVKQGDVLMIIAPEKNGTIIGRINLPVYRSAKVKEGQLVNIRLANYPSDEYGILTGQIASVSILPKDSLYSVKVIFPNGMKSSYNKQLEFKQQMTGSAEIITSKERLLSRMFNKVRM
ncbi:MAG TPA: HlyD family efflux transporter periplasmic adaptor subunit, partial [Bacteroidia bacterium]|nr:HlyD family efflux transporter periplasmic adaptor subunit [Bacteroidia bacterium]